MRNEVVLYTFRELRLEDFIELEIVVVMYFHGLCKLPNAGTRNIQGMKIPDGKKGEKYFRLP
jgi:hypothetical protein